MANSSNDTPVYGPRPYGLTENDHRGIVMTMTILFVVYACMVLGVRLAARYRNMGLEDWLSIVATALAIPQFTAVIVATVDAGFGSSYSLLSSSDTATVARCIRASDVLFLLSLFVTKCSVIWFCRRLFAIGQHKNHVLCEALIGLCAAWCLGSILGVTVGCSSRETIQANGQRCSNLVSRWTAVGVLDAVLEVAIWALSMVVITPLQMSWQRKLQASTCFFLRLPIIVFIGLNIKYVSNFNSASNAGMALISPVLFRQSELFYALLSAAVPSLNQYLRKFDTAHATHFGYRADQYGSGGHTYQLDTMSNQRSKNRAGRVAPAKGTGHAGEVLGKSTGINFTPVGHSQYQTRIEGPNNGKNNDGTSNASQEEGSIGRAGSEEHIIRKDVVYEVRREY